MRRHALSPTTLIQYLRRDRNASRSMCEWAASELRLIAEGSAQGLLVDERANNAATELESFVQRTAKVRR